MSTCSWDVLNLNLLINFIKWVKYTAVIKTAFFRGTWLAQSVEHVILDLRPMSSSPTLGQELTLKKPKKQKKKTLFSWPCVCTSYKRSELTVTYWEAPSTQEENKTQGVPTNSRRLWGWWWNPGIATERTQATLSAPLDGFQTPLLS